MRDQLSLVLEAARRRGTPPDHVLLSGPPGLGKTTLAMLIGTELERPIRITSGPAIQHAGDLAAVLSSLTEGEVLFLDEIHRMSRSAEEMLYLAMEDFRVDVIVGKGPGATAIPLELPPFTVVGATTRAGLLPAPLRDRFGFTGHLDFYATDDLVAILHRSARLLEVAADTDGITEIAAPVAGHTAHRQPPAAPGPRLGAGARPRTSSTRRPPTPRWPCSTSTTAAWTGSTGPSSTRCAAGSAAGPVGLSTLAVAVGEEADTVETVAEPFLVREGFIVRTPRGRAATRAGLGAPRADAAGRPRPPARPCRSTPARAASAPEDPPGSAPSREMVTIGTRLRQGTLVGMPCVTYTRAVTGRVPGPVRAR